MSNTVLGFYNATLADILYRDLMNSRDSFKILDVGTKPGYPIDIYFENLDRHAEMLMKFEVALPGVDPRDVTVTRNQDGELRIRYEKPTPPTEPDGTLKNREYVVRTISQKSFDLSWKISRKFDLNRLESFWKNGLLTISIPVSAASLPEEVPVAIL